MRQRRETEEIPITNRSESASEKAGNNSSNDFKNVGEELRTRCEENLQHTKNAPEQESNWQIDGPSSKSERSDARAGKTIDTNKDPRRVHVFGPSDFIKAGHRFVQIYTVMYDFFVDLVCVSKLSEVYPLSGSYDSDLSCMHISIIKRYNHAPGDIEKLTLDFENPG